jgi:hypothetical protein
MTIDELIASHPVPATGDGLLDVAQAVIAADDVTADERGPFAVGFLMGLSYALAKHNEGGITDAARTLLRLQNEWAANEVFG